ncbi:hypothetical protein AB0D27_35970 [Streptomyces sp. NPDC048415]|uniref:hypothetical protein n=1 Tax=Streptomyces sp. NPDC048415 TaxID=3154822 RepID=UPI003421C834
MGAGPRLHRQLHRAVAPITDPRFRISTTVAAWRGQPYLPDARLDAEPAPETEYDVGAVDQV